MFDIDREHPEYKLRKQIWRQYRDLYAGGEQLRLAAEECPKSLVTPQSLEWIERFFTWKFAGGGGAFDEMPARDADAFLILEREWRDGQHEST